jgi:hypothetical protein
MAVVLEIDIVCVRFDLPQRFMLKIREEYMRERWE